MEEESADKPDEVGADRRLERFIATALHDVRNPLNAASLLAQLLVQRFGSGLSEEPRRIASEIPRQLTKARKVLDGIQTIVGVLFSASSSDLVPLEEALNSAMESLEQEFRVREGRVERETLPLVRGDGAQLAEVFRQILSNALRFNDGQHPVIRITCTDSECGCTISIRDTGFGFEPKFAEQIFEPFERLHDQERSGAGLGLAFCREVLLRHGGRIWAESRLGEGSVFHLEFPPVRKPLDPPAQKAL